MQVTNWSGACYIFPLLGAYIADSHLGRYNTIIIFSIIYILVSEPAAGKGPPALPPSLLPGLACCYASLSTPKHASTV